MSKPRSQFSESLKQQPLRDKLVSKQAKDLGTQGVDHAYRKNGAGKLLQESRKLNYPAPVHLREIIKFPEYKIPEKTEWRCKSQSKKLRQAIEEPLKTIRRFYPSKATIRSHIYKSIVKERFSKFDQEDLLKRVQLWKKTSPDDSFAYHPYATYASEEESTRPEEDSDGESDNEGEDERIIKTSTKGFLFVHQSKDQRRLLERLAIWKRNLLTLTIRL
ncbi:unnamed protein product [Porites lobata]|uniref:Uncharacterized protein n=1 Tax=Porites lobata TaxID=104759 RepID=A0ABN8QBZ0_9CNID|nr:unnamed protein product [Porites lobata]